MSGVAAALRDEVGLVYLNNRYYDPTLGTFISVDPLVQATGEPYIYASGNPSTLSDPTGRCADAGCWEMLGVVMRELAGLEKPGVTGQRQLELNEAISESIFENYSNYDKSGEAMYTPADRPRSPAVGPDAEVGALVYTAAPGSRESSTG